MSKWTKIYAGFDADDETTNFGKRNVAETTASIYESWTLATIQSETPVLRDPHISASLIQSHLCLVVDNYITIFDSPSCKKILSNIGFDSQITSYCLSANGQYLFVSTIPATFCCFNLDANGQQLFSIDLNKKYNIENIIKIWFKSSSDNSVSELIIVTTNGEIYKISDINSLLAGDKSIEDLQCLLPQNFLILSSKRTIQRANSRLNEATNELSLVLLGENEIFLHPDNISCPTDNLPLTQCYSKVEFFHGYSGIICLCSDGKLSIVCPQTLIGKKIFDGTVIDFVTINDKSDTFYLLALIKPDPEATHLSLQLMTFPDFKIIYTMHVSSSTFLVDVEDNNPMDIMIILEGMRNSSNEIIDTVRIQAIGESLPENRLKRLLRQKRFNEAQVFARKYSLDSQYILQAEISILLQNLCSFQSVDQDNIDYNTILNNFITALDKITDIKFVYQCCINCIYINIDYSITEKLCAYVKKRIVEDISTNDRRNYDSINFLKCVNDTLRKLDTFKYIQQLEDTQENANNQPDKFLNANLLNECARYLSIGHLKAAAIIWVRHISLEINPNIITQNVLEELLDLIPVTLTPDELSPWIQYLIPSIMSSLPSAIDVVITWGYNKIRLLEQYYRNNWQELGLQFMHEFIDLLQFDDYYYQQMNQQYINKQSKFHRLLALQQSVSDLLELKTEYKLNLPLNVYQGEQPIDIVMLLLNKIQRDSLKVLIKNFLQPYMKKYSLDNDTTLSKYIKTTLNNYRNWWIFDIAPWDRRLPFIADFIHSVGNRIQTTIEILRKAPVPWSFNVLALVNRMSGYDNPLVAQMSLEREFAKMKVIYKKYGFAHIGPCTKLYNNIIKTNNSFMIDDLLEVTKNSADLRTNIFYTCINYHLNRDNIKLVLKVLKRLDTDIFLNCCKQMSYVMTLELKNKEDNNEILKSYFTILSDVELQIRKIIQNKYKHNNVELNEFLQNLELLKKLYNLRVKYNIVISFEDYYLNKKIIMSEFISNLIHESNEPETRWLYICKTISEVNSILDLPKFCGIYQLLIITEKSLTIKDYLILRFDENYFMMPEECEYIRKICYQLTIIADKDYELAIFLKTLYPSMLMNSTDLPEYLDTAGKIDAYTVALGADNIRDNEEPASESLTKQYSVYMEVSSSAEIGLLLQFYKQAFEIADHYNPHVYNDDQDNQNNQRTDDEFFNIMEILKKHLIDSAVILEVDHQNYTLFKILSAVQSHLLFLQADSYAFLVILMLQKNFITNMFNDIMQERPVDLFLGLACLLSLSEPDAMGVLEPITKGIQLDFSRDRIINDLGYEYCKFIGNSQIKYFENRKFFHKWVPRLAPYHVSFSKLILSNKRGYSQILHRIMENSRGVNTIKVIEDFCIAFGFKTRGCLIDYMRTLMRSWKPQYRIKIEKGANKMIVENTDMKELKILCTKVMNIIDSIKTNNDEPFTLTGLMKEINIYHYELFIILLEMSPDKATVRISQLHFLQNYTRIGPPTNLERNAWARISPEDTHLPDIAKWRLPFLPTEDQAKIVAPELNLSTYEQWLTIGRRIHVYNSSVCTIAVKGSVAEVWKKKGDPSEDDEDSTEWSLESLYGDFLEDIRKCLNHLVTEIQLQYKTAGWYHVVKHAPPGVDLVEAAKECYTTVRQWYDLYDTCPTRRKELEKIYNKYYEYTTKHMLYRHGLGYDKYLKLVNSPEQLIRELYHDETIPQRYKELIEFEPDINSVVMEFGELVPLNISQLRLDLLNEWLQPKIEVWDSNKSYDMTIDIGQKMNTSTSDTYNTVIDDNILRACYITESGDREKYIQYLIDMSFCNENNSAGVRFRALKVVQSLLEEVELLDYIKGDHGTTREYIKSLYYLAELEKLGINYSISDFQSRSKLKIIEKLINNQYSSPRALTLIPQIYIDFDVKDYKLLSVALLQMVKCSLVNELKASLLALGSTYRAHFCHGYITGWQTVVQSAFDKLNSNPKDTTVARCIEMLKLLHACPVVDKLLLNTIINHCIECKQLHFAFALVQFLSNENEKSNIMETIKRNPDYDNITEQLSELEKKGITIVME